MIHLKYNSEAKADSTIDGDRRWAVFCFTYQRDAEALPSAFDGRWVHAHLWRPAERRGEWLREECRRRGEEEAAKPHPIQEAAARELLAILPSDMSNIPHAATLFVVNVQPQLDRASGAHPLAGALGDASAVLISGQIADRGQSGTFRLSHWSRGVRRRLLGRETFQQSTRFLIGADRGNLQDRSAVTGFDEALVVAHSSALGGLGIWQRRKVKLVGVVQDVALVDETVNGQSPA